MPTERLKQDLESEHVHYSTLTHPLSYTAQEIAAVAHVAGKQFAKTVVVDLDGDKVLAVLPADKEIALPELRRNAGAPAARFATEKEFRSLSPDCEMGAMPLFGNLYQIKVFAAEPLTEDDVIAFNTGSHTEVMEIPYHKGILIIAHK